MRFVPARAVVAILALAFGVAAPAQPLPRVIKLVVPFSAGGSNDVIARAIAQPLGTRLGTTVVVENKPGAAGVIGSDYVAKAPKDGSVLLLSSSSFLTAAATQKELPYDPLAAFAPVAMVGRGPMLLVVSAATPYQSLDEFVAAARARPDTLNYGTAGVGSIAHLTTELLDDTAKIQMVHVPYKGAANAATDLAGGQIQAMISNYSSVAPLMKGGKIRAVAVTSAKKHPAFPDLPPLASVAPGFDVDIWVGVFAPAGTPDAIVQRFNREIDAIAASPELAPVLEPDGTLPEAIAPAVFASRIRQELGQWKRIASDHHIVAQ
jgi:tripartite-type tricarboxylate transporter receptor subunit TctC